MINKGKGKLKWERDMPRDIEEKLEVIIMMVIVMVGKKKLCEKEKFMSPFYDFVPHFAPE